MDFRGACIVFGKSSGAEEVKSRLESVFGADGCRALNSAFLKDAVELADGVEADTVIYLEGLPGPEDLPDAERTWFVQSGEDLGERMLYAFAVTFARGYERIVLIGTDIPTLPGEFIDLAFTELEQRNSIVVGPSEDGGYYLIGMSDLHPSLFTNLSYGHERVFEQVMDRIAALPARISVLPPLSDVDTPEQVAQLMDDLMSLPPGTAHHTRRALGNPAGESPGEDFR